MTWTRILAATGGAWLAYHTVGGLIWWADRVRAWYRAWRRSTRMPRRIVERFPLSHLLRIFRRAPERPVLYDQDAATDWIGESIVVDFRTWQHRHHHDTPGGAA